MDASDEKILFGRKRTAAALDISLRTLDHLVQNGQLLHIRIGKRIMFTRSAIEKFVKRVMAS